MTTNRPQIGTKAPSFKTMGIGGKYGNGQEISLENLKGKIVVLYFYPKDNTPGCTKQACALRDNWSEVESKAEIFGISPDSPESHQKFIDKFDLPFPLLSDVNKELVQAFGVWVEKSMYGKKYFGTERSTFIIDQDGNIRDILAKVKPEEHLDKLLKSLSTMI